MDNKTKKILKYSGIALTALVIIYFYFTFIYQLALATWIDTDYANLVLEAKDIVNGNVFLSGWNQTGVSFLLTDILYFVVGVFVFGLSKSAYILAIILMFIFTMVTTFFLTEFKSIKNNILFFALTAFPTIAMFELLRAHTGGYILTFLIFIIVDRCLSKNKISMLNSILMVAFVAMISLSDAASLVFGTFSLAIICIYKLLFDKESSKKFYGTLLGLMMLGTIGGIIFDKLYYIIGGANKNSFLGSQSLIPINEFMDKLFIYLDSVFTLSNANIFGNPIFKFSTIINCMYVPIVIIGFYLTYWNIKMFIKNNNKDIISVAISIGFVLVSLTFIFTTVGVNIYSSRYFATLPFFFAVLICRYIKNKNLMEKNIFTSDIKWKYIIVAFSIISLVGGFVVVSKSVQNEFITEQEGIVGVLRDNNLKNGYGSYWDSSVPSLTSEGEINVRQITTDENSASPLIWFCKDEWYESEANFVLIHRPESAPYGVTEENISEIFGDPDKKIEHDAYVIYVYSYDISKKLVH